MPTTDNVPDVLHEDASLDSIDAEYSGIATTSSSRNSSMADGRAKRMRRADPTEKLLEIKRQTFESLRTCVAGINDARSQLSNKDEFDTFAEMVATTLRSMPVKFAQQTKLELNCLLAEKNTLAVRKHPRYNEMQIICSYFMFFIQARAELRKSKQKQLSPILLQTNDGEMVPFYAMGENDEEFDPNKHTRLMVYDVNGEQVTDKAITETIRASHITQI